MHPRVNNRTLASALVAALLAGGSWVATVSAASTPSTSAAPMPSTPAAATPSTSAPRDAANRSAYRVESPSDSTPTPHAPTRVEIRGFVHDANGGPVRGATVRLMSESDTVRVMSDGSGHFHGRLTALDGVRVLVQAYGYRDQLRTYQVSQPVLQVGLALPPPYPLGWVTVTMADDRMEGLKEGLERSRARSA